MCGNPLDKRKGTRLIPDPIEAALLRLNLLAAKDCFITVSFTMKIGRQSQDTGMFSTMKDRLLTPMRFFEDVLVTEEC